MTISNSNQTFKADGGKIEANLLFEGMPRALLAICAVLSYGAQKYEAHSWKKVEMSRYRAAKFRHLLDEYLGKGSDEESGLPHSFHEACNTLFLLEDSLSKLSHDEFEAVMKFNKPPTTHKENKDG